MALEGVLKLTWLLLCQDELTKAWAANMECAQSALLADDSEV